MAMQICAGLKKFLSILKDRLGLISLITCTLTVLNPYMRRSMNFRPGGGEGGGPGRSDKKALTFFFSPQLILQKSNGQFQRNLSFFKVPERVQHFPGGWGGGIAYSL